MSVAIIRFILLISALAIAGSQGYKILGIVPYGLKSNYYIGYSIMKGLADAGHEVTIITPFRGAPIKHLREILLDGSFDQQLGELNISEALFECVEQEFRENIDRAQFVNVTCRTTHGCVGIEKQESDGYAGDVI